MIKYKFEYDLDDPRRTLQHRELILKKPFLKKLYLSWYNKIIKGAKDVPAGKKIEIGSGGGFLKDVFPEIISSDILPLSNCDLVFSAEEIPFENEELSLICMVNVLHHIPSPAKFFTEAQRTLKINGKIILIEPANSIFGRFIYQNFHHEPFKPSAGWEIESSGPLSSANGALPWIILERDQEEFYKKFPFLKITKLNYHTSFSYLLSGGVSRKGFVPDFSFEFINAFDNLISSRLSGMFIYTEIKKF